MSKFNTAFQCQECAYSSPKWLGKCPECGAWNSFVEEKPARGPGLSRRSGRSGLSGHSGQFSSGFSPGALRRPSASEAVPLAIPLDSIAISDEDRLGTGIQELDRVLGGGIVAGSLCLIGGDPGIGKSTIVLQLLDGLYRNASGLRGPALYVSGEESIKQIKMRASRLGIDGTSISVLSETCLESVFEQVEKLSPAIIVVDSIQTVYTEEISSAPGSVSQVRESALKLMGYAKQTSTPVFIVGHVTKEGAIAGPRTLEHIVDTVIYFEGDRGHPYRILRAVKNRFGSTNEIGVFEMREGGLVEVTNPSELFLSERSGSSTGTAVVSTIEGTRPLMVELQALVCPSTYGVPRRTGMGVDINRVNLLVAVLEKLGGLHLGGMDIFLNVVGGLKITEPAFDLGVVATIASSFRDIPVKEDTFVFGEAGLSGEIRAVSQAEARIKEGTRIGFKHAIIPYSNASRLSFKPSIEIIGVKSIDEALRISVSR